MVFEIIPEWRSESSRIQRSASPESPAGKKLMEAGGLDVGGIEYLEAQDGRLIFYDINANSNLRAPIAQVFGFDPFERVVDFLVSQIGLLQR